MVGMEFKGTKEKWELLKGKGSCGVSIGSKTTMIFSDGDVEELANAQLISKAPELLDFINRISGEMLRSDFVLSEEWYEQAKELINQSTEI